MKKLFILILLVLLSGFIFFVAREKVKQDFARPVPYPTMTISPSMAVQNKINTPETQSVFVPYWSLKEKADTQKMFDSYIYFGIAPTRDGIDTKEAGALALDKFLAFVPGNQKKLLALRMIEANNNFAILEDQNAQKKVIQETIALSKAHEFDGIVLDLEVSAIPFDSLVQQINSFTKLFYQEARKQNLSFALTMYGDVFYRVRPFEVKELSKNADTLMIMAYDFSKAKGNPGPNFPLRGNDTYGYDYEQMTQDFLRVVPAEKLTVIFGLFGYDWVVDGQGRPLGQAKAMSLQVIQKKFIESCAYKDCSVSRDEEAGEGQIYYRDESGRKHIIWFEDMESVAAKKVYLKEQGITSFSYWAYSYF